MFLQPGHTKPEVYSETQTLALECYEITRLFLLEEKFALVQQIRRAAISVYLNLAEGSSRKSLPERKRYYEISRGSVIEIDSAFGIAQKSAYVSLERLKPLGESIVKVFKMLSGMIKE